MKLSATLWRRRGATQRIICVMLLLTLTPTLFAQELGNMPNAEYNDGKVQGKIAAGKDYSSMGWVAAGFGGGLLLGIIGTGVVAGLSQSGSAEPSDNRVMEISGKSGAFRSGFYEGYNKKAKSKRLLSSLVGGALGTTVAVIIIVNASK